MEKENLFTDDQLMYLTKELIIPCMESYMTIAEPMHLENLEVITKSIMGKVRHKIKLLELENMKMLSYINQIQFNSIDVGKSIWQDYSKQWDELNKDTVEKYLEGDN